MSLQFIIKFGAGKSRYAYEKILAEAARHPEKLSDRRAGAVYDADAERTPCLCIRRAGILNIDILSFQRLAYRIFEEETGGSLYPVLEETGKASW